MDKEEFDWNDFEESVPDVFDKIVDYTIRDQGLLCDRKFLGKARLISRGWMQSVTRSLKSRGEPLYSVVITTSTHGKLDRFVRFLLSSVPPDLRDFRLVLGPKVFLAHNYDSLHRCFTKCGTYLTELSLHVPMDGAALPSRWRQLQLPALRRLDAWFYFYKDGRGAGAPNGVPVENVLSSCIRGARALEHLGFSGIHLSTFWQIDVMYSCPQSLTRLSLSVASRPLLEALTRIALPNLEELEFSWMLIPMDLLHRFLNNYRLHLRRLSVTMGAFRLQYPPIHFINLPRMEKLEHFKLAGGDLKLMPKLGPIMPKLHTLELQLERNQNGAIEWLDDPRSNSNSEVESVRKVKLSGYWAEEEMLMAVNQSFPNLCSLDVAFSAEDGENWFYLFEDMAHLERLDITLFNTDVFDEGWPNKLESLITNISDNLLSKMETDGNLEQYNDEFHPVGIFSGLKILRLWMQRSEQDQPEDLLIPEAVYTQAFKKLPNLKEMTIQEKGEEKDSFCEESSRFQFDLL